MQRRNAYLVIVRTRVDEALAIARVVRARVERKIAEGQLAQGRRWALLRRAALARRQQLVRILGRVGVGKDL